jgi:hypothetical protein
MIAVTYLIKYSKNPEESTAADSREWTEFVSRVEA